MLSGYDQSAIARDLEQKYNADIRRGAVPGVMSVTFRVPRPGMLEVKFQLNGLTSTSPYTCDEHDTANYESYRAAVDWCFRDALERTWRPVDLETQCAMAENVNRQLKASLYTMNGVRNIDISMQQKDLLRITMVFSNGIHTSRCYRCRPEDNQNAAAFTAFVNRCFSDFGNRPQSEIRREVESQMGVKTRSPWMIVLTVVIVLIAIASGIGIFFLLIVLIAAASMSDNNTHNRRRRW